MGEGEEKEAAYKPKVFILDTNVLMLNQWAPHILGGSWEEVLEDEAGSQLAELIRKEEKKLDDSPNTVVISSVVERELDQITHGSRKDGATVLARRAIKVLENIRLQGQEYIDDQDITGNKVKLSNGGEIHFVEHNEREFRKAKENIPDPENDDRILYCVEQYAKKQIEKDVQVQFVSQDRNAKNRARDLFVQLLHNKKNKEEYLEDAVDELWCENIREPYQQYTGIFPVTLDQNERKLFKDNYNITKQDTRPKPLQSVQLKPNQFLDLRDNSGKREYRIIKKQNGDMIATPLVHQRELLGAFVSLHNDQLKDEHLHKGQDVHKIIDTLNISSDRVNQLRKKIHGNKQDAHEAYESILQKEYKNIFEEQEELFKSLPFNQKLKPVAEQELALELIADKSINLVSIVGPQGSGKTMWATYGAIAQVARGDYSSITYFKPIVSVGNELGYLPGTFGEKAEPWMKPCRHALEEVFGVYDLPPLERQERKKIITELENEGIVEYDVASWQAGQTWRDTMVIIDEAHLFTREQMRLLIGRMGQGTKAILLGDPKQVASTATQTYRYLNERNNGLSHVIERLPGKKIYGHVALDSDEVILRSEAAKLARQL